MKNKLFASLLLASGLLALNGCNKQINHDTTLEVKFVLSVESLTLNVNDDYTLDYTVENNSSSVRFSSSNNSVVGVSGNRLIAKNEGTATITGEVDGVIRTCEVTVTSDGSGQYFIDSSKSFNVEIGSEGLVPEFNYFVIKDNKKEEILNEIATFEVKDQSIAKIVDDKIVPVSVGQTTLKVDYPKASAEYILNVCTKVITKETQFFNMLANKEVGSFFALENDLDFTGKTYDAYSTSNDLTNYGSCFKGTFEGNGHTIKGIKISGNSKNHSIFGCLYNAHIKDVNFEDVVLENKGADSISVIANGVTGDDCEIKNVKVSCDIKGSTSGNIYLLTAKYLENSYRLYKSDTEFETVSTGPSVFSNIVIDAKFDGKTMEQANCHIVAKDANNFVPQCDNVLIYAPGGNNVDGVEGINVYSNKLDLIWDVHNQKYLPDTNWDYSEPFDIPSLSNSSASSGYVYNQSSKIEIDPNYEIIKAKSAGVEHVVFPYGDHIEGYVYGDHPTEASHQAVFVNQRLASYAQNLTIPAADVYLNEYSKVCFFVRTKTFNKSWITIKDLNTNRDYSTNEYDCEVSSKWVKVELEKQSEGNWNVYIGNSKIRFTYPANYFKDIPLRFNDTRYYYSEMFGVRDPNVIPKNWVNVGAVASKMDGGALSTVNNVICTQVESTQSSVIQYTGSGDLAKFNAQDITSSKEFKFYARGAANDSTYFIISRNNSDTIAGVQGLVSFKATTTEWTSFKFVIGEGKISIYRNESFLADVENASLDEFGIQLSGGKFYISEMFAFK